MKLTIVLVGILLIAASLSRRSAIAVSLPQHISDLHQKAALGARWADFGEGSWVRTRVHNTSPSGDETFFGIEEVTNRLPAEIKTTYWDADHKQSLGERRYALEAPDFVPAKASPQADDSVVIGRQVYPARVYQFEKSYPVLRETRTIRWTFWISASPPYRELKRVTESESEDPGYGGTSKTTLSNLDVPFVVGNKTLHCYCIDMEEKENDGTSTNITACYNDLVPGRVVKKDARVWKNGKETLRQEYTVVEFHVERVQP